MRWLLVTAAALLASAISFVAGVAFDQHSQRYPKIVVEGSKNSRDILAVIRRCGVRATWPVTLKEGEPLLLEQRVCPSGMHFKQIEDDDAEWPAKHQVLLLERQERWKTSIITVLSSDLDFQKVEVGKAANGLNAVLWSYFVRCGSCHGGPEGVLLWNAIKKQYDWNENWVQTKPVTDAIDAVLPDGYYPDEADSLFWTEDHSSLELRGLAHSDRDAHCCATGGNIFSEISTTDGVLHLGTVTHQPSVDVH